MVAKNVLGGNSGGSSGQQPSKKVHLHSNSHVTAMDIPTGPSTQKHGGGPVKSSSNSYENMATRDSHQRGYSHNSALIASLELKSSSKKQEGSESIRNSNIAPNIALNIAN